MIEVVVESGNGGGGGARPSPRSSATTSATSACNNSGGSDGNGGTATNELTADNVDMVRAALRHKDARLLTARSRWHRAHATHGLGQVEWGYDDSSHTKGSSADRVSGQVWRRASARELEIRELAAKRAREGPRGDSWGPVSTLTVRARAIGAGGSSTDMNTVVGCVAECGCTGDPIDCFDENHVFQCVCHGAHRAEPGYFRCPGCDRSEVDSSASRDQARHLVTFKSVWEYYRYRRGERLMGKDGNPVTTASDMMFGEKARAAEREKEKERAEAVFLSKLLGTQVRDEDADAAVIGGNATNPFSRKADVHAKKAIAIPKPLLRAMRGKERQFSTLIHSPTFLYRNLRVCQYCAAVFGAVTKHVSRVAIQRSVDERKVRRAKQHEDHLRVRRRRNRIEATKKAWDLKRREAIEDEEERQRLEDERAVAPSYYGTGFAAAAAQRWKTSGGYGNYTRGGREGRGEGREGRG